MSEFVVKVPEDVGMEFPKVSKERWQLLFSRFVREKISETREVSDIASKSKATPKQIGELTKSVRASIAERFLKE